MEIIEYSLLLLDGHLDSNQASTLSDRLNELSDQTNHSIILDFSKVKFVSSAILKVFLVTATKLATKKHKLLLCHLNVNVQEVFDISGFSTLFTIYRSLDDLITT